MDLCSVICQLYLNTVDYKPLFSPTPFIAAGSDVSGPVLMRALINTLANSNYPGSYFLARIKFMSGLNVL